MNYDEARQLGAESENPGKWNWTTINDGHIRTASPCAWPDFVWPNDPLGIVSGAIKPTGRERCDHDTREEAERHQYDASFAKATIDELDLDGIHERRRCELVGCNGWETHRTNWHDGYRITHLCEDHANLAGLAEIHPFIPGMRSMHS